MHENTVSREQLTEAITTLRKTLAELELIAAQMKDAGLSEVNTTNWKTVTRSIELLSRGPKALNHAIFKANTEKLLLKSMQETLAKEKAQRATKKKAKE